MESGTGGLSASSSISYSPDIRLSFPSFEYATAENQESLDRHAVTQPQAAAAMHANPAYIPYQNNCWVFEEQICEW